MSFENIAEKTLESLMDRIDEVLGGCLDVDLVGGVLTIELETGACYVINKHAPNRQIWVSSPISGASHFDYHEGRDEWISTRSEATLTGLLAQELGAATGIPIDLDQ
ncbi:MAG: iron donor protein CyaY [Rhodospirillales bacterium]